MQERRLVNFLDSIKHKAGAIYLLGDMFDFWFEYKTVVPRGYTRFLGKISELTDKGIEVHYFTGNHDLWMNGYLEEECGVILHRETATTCEIYGKLFYLAHGDGLNDAEKGFKFLRKVFHNRFCQRCFAMLHPSWGVSFGRNWARHSRLKREDGQEPPFQGEKNEPLICFAKEYLNDHPDINYFIFGHRHIEYDLFLSRTSRLILLGEWIELCTYAVFDGEHMFVENFIEGESEP